MNDDVALALARLLLALPDMRRVPPYWRLLCPWRARAVRLRSPGVSASSVLHQGVYAHRGVSLTLGDGAVLRHRVRIGIDEPGLNASSFSLGDGSVVLSDTHIDCSAPVTIGHGTHIGRRNQLFTHTHDVANRDMPVLCAPTISRPVTIGDDVMLFNDVVILPGVTIGNGAIVAIRSVVTRDVAPYAKMAGAPARQVGERR